jgi:hypothetical protein
VGEGGQVVGRTGTLGHDCLGGRRKPGCRFVSSGHCCHDPPPGGCCCYDSGVPGGARGWLSFPAVGIRFWWRQSHGDEIFLPKRRQDKDLGTFVSATPLTPPLGRETKRLASPNPPKPLLSPKRSALHNPQPNRCAARRHGRGQEEWRQDHGDAPTTPVPQVASVDVTSARSRTRHVRGGGWDRYTQVIIRCTQIPGFHAISLGFYLPVIGEQLGEARGRCRGGSVPAIPGPCRRPPWPAPPLPGPPLASLPG